jgi:hypothetical protein
MSREVLCGLDVFQDARYASRTTGIWSTALHFYLIVIKFVIGNDTVDAG